MSESDSRRHSKRLISLQVCYLAFLSIFSVYRGVFPGPEYMFVLCLLVVVWRSDTRRFLGSFLPFVLLLLSYEVLRGYAKEFALTQIHFQELIRWEKAIFGGVVPAAWMQNVFLGSRWMRPLLIVCNAFYVSHFVLPVVVALLIWQRAPEYYWRYVIGLLVLSYAGFVTYLLYPAAPPWLVSYAGLLPGLPVRNLTRFSVVDYLMRFKPNAFAAMPSLHAAYPIYIAAFCIWIWKKRALVMLVFPVGVFIATVFLGQHWVIDLVAGAAYAMAVFVLVWLRSQHKQVAQSVLTLPAAGARATKSPSPVQTAQSL